MKRSILAGTIAVLLAVVGCLSLLAYARGADARALAGQKAVRVLAATKRIPAGTTGQQIREGGYAAPITVPAGTVPADALAAIDTGLDALALTADVQPRQLVLRGAFGAPSVLSGGITVPAGMLAVSVAVHASAEVAGYLQPGASVAIFDTFTVADGKPADGKGQVPAGDGLTANHGYDQATRLLLSGIPVLAIGARGTAGAQVAPSTGTSSGLTGSATAGGADASLVLITVAATQDQATRLVHAAQTGSLYLALLGGSPAVTPGAGIDNYSLFP